VRSLPHVAVDFAPVARLLGSPARAAMVDALFDGRSLTASELAAVAGIGRPAASAHLAALVAGGLVAVEASGRERRHRIASADVAVALEALAGICPPTPTRSLRQSSEAARLAGARLCYDHLAGRLGVGVLDALVAQRWLRPASHGWDVTARGDDALGALGVDVAAARARRRAFARSCLDWTERRPHLAGALGAAVAQHALAAGWVRRADGRGLVVTPSGCERLVADLHVDPTAVGRPAGGAGV
jgi:DNA-binding transcriptional ArsR family regulator